MNRVSSPLVPVLALLLAFAFSGRALGAENPHNQATAAHAPGTTVAPNAENLITPTAQQTDEALAAADGLIARGDLAVYRGWLKYLKFRATADARRIGPDSVEARTAYANLVEWTAKIGADPHIIEKLRGVHEWAYESQTDGSGQPFRLNIPLDYSPDRPAGLVLACHGYSGNHLEHSGGMAPHRGRFEAAVLGRARGGMYRMLSERDVLDVLAYVKRTWKIDENRVELTGGSMGGFASMWLGSRYPDLFACSRPSCGWALYSPVENLVNLPVYSLHSKDDPVVHVIGSRGPLQQVRDAGGMAIIEETDGYGHAVWNWADGQARSAAWGERQVRVDPLTVCEINYTAIDGVASGAWWAHVAEWGPHQAPATFRLRLGTANDLYGALSNIARLRLDLARSPVDRAQPLQLSLDAAKPVVLPAPLPAAIDIVVDATGARFEAPDSPDVRRHTPGAAAMVYDGSPLLIVVGTTGDAATNAAMREAAIAASKSPNPSWPVDKFENASQDGVSHYQNLYGQLPIKADREVTDRDIADHNLVLIGSATQNSLVARLAAQLPVSEAGGVLKSSDGFAYPFSGNAVALVHYNPLAPQRLLLWIASPEKDFYRPGALLPRELYNHSSGADFVVMSNEGRVFAARSFDARWNWSAAYAQSSVLPAPATTKSGWATLQADLFKKAAGAGFGAAMKGYKSNWIYRDSFMAADGVTRYADMALLNYQFRLFLVDVKGSELLRLRKLLAENADAPLGMSPDFASSPLDPEKTYTVTVDWDSLSPLSEQLHWLPQSVRATGIWEAAAIFRESAKPH